VIGEAKTEAMIGPLALLGRPGSGCLDDRQSSREEMVDRAGVGRAAEVEALAQSLEGGGVLSWPQVEVAAEEQRRATSPLDRRLSRAQDVGGGEIGPVVGRVQVGDAKAGSSPRERHRPPLRSPLVDGHLPSLDDALAADQGQVRAALPGSDQVGIAAGDEAAQGAERVARGEHTVGRGIAGLGQRCDKTGWALLQQGDVPGGRGQHFGELADQLAVDLDVRRIALLDPQHP
jgi:hypothetical protein